MKIPFFSKFDFEKEEAEFLKKASPLLRGCYQHAKNDLHSTEWVSILKSFQKRLKEEN